MVGRGAFCCRRGEQIRRHARDGIRHGGLPTVVRVNRVSELERTWPGGSQRRPSRSDTGWSVRAPLAAWLRREGQASAGKRVLDVGCGLKPYYPFFAAAAEYVGVDVVETPSTDLIGPIESLPVDDGSFDIVLCTQVLEHAD